MSMPIMPTFLAVTFLIVTSRSLPGAGLGWSPSRKVFRRAPRRMLIGTVTPSIVTSLIVTLRRSPPSTA